MGAVAASKGLRKREAGYTLLDALIALAIISISISSCGLLLRGVHLRQALLLEKTAAVMEERNSMGANQ